MLPLWIIDITKPSERRDAFLRLVGQIDHVLIKNAKFSDEDKAGDNAEYNNNIEDSGSETVNEDTQAGPKIFSSENIYSEEERIATRNARIEGNYWYYSSYEFDELFDTEDINNDATDFEDIDHQDLPEEEKERRLQGKIKQLKTTAKHLYDFQCALVEDAMDFVMTLRESNAKPFQPINIVVLGDATEQFTQLVFPSIATILQKEKGRFLAGHIHQGMSIIGMLYVPCNVNAQKVEHREKVLRLFKEIEVQHNIPTMRGYDNMMLYQDVQNRTECIYRRLKPNELAEYLVQCLVNMYLACDINHPLLSGTGSDDTFYFSMGASSIYFDMTVEDKNDANLVALNIVNVFKESGDGEDTEIDIQLFDKKDYSADVFVEKFNVEDVDIDDNDDIQEPKPHPISDALHHSLKRLYYEYYLRFFPADLLRDTMQRIEDSTNSQLEKISVHCLNSLQNCQRALPVAIERVFSKVNKNVGGLAFMEDRFHKMQEAISKEKSNIQRAINAKYWDGILEKKQDSHFDFYHDTYMTDIRTKNSGAGCNALKQEELASLKELLSNETTTLSAVIRCVFLGIINVLGVLPMLAALSPDYINLGDIPKYSFLWGALLFIIPAIAFWIKHLIYLRKKRRLIHRLKTYYTHDAYARLANRIESEAVLFYNKMLALLDEYLDRCRLIRNEVNIITPDPTLKLLFPQSKFNQPLNGGEFDGEPLIPAADIKCSSIRVDHYAVLVNALTRDQYFVLINGFKEQFASLFSGVTLMDSHARRFDETVGDYIFESRDEILKAKKEAWEQTKLNFNTELFKYIKERMLPRAYPTIGDKLQQYSKNPDNCAILEYMIAFAASNGEFASQRDTEYADVKMNRHIEYLVEPYLPYYTTNLQCSEWEEIFKRYIFVTRWRTYKHLSYNRLLPEEDFDIASREERVFHFEEAKNRRKKKSKSKENLINNIGVDLKNDDAEIVLDKRTPPPVLSSIVLWSVCPDDHSNEWLKLFEVDHFNIAYKQRCIFREVMNQND